MNKKHSLLSVLGLCSLLITLPSCLDDDDSSYIYRSTALVTVCPDNDGSFIMQLDDNTQLVPTNLKSSPFGEKEVRALLSYTEDGEFTKDDKIINVQVNRLDSIRTKLPVETVGDKNDEEYGCDPVEIIRDWVTVAEDGYLTLRLRTLWGSANAKHVVNLVTGVNPSDPYEFELRHDAQGDKNGRWGDALIAFNLNKLPRPAGDKTKIKLKWKSFSGDKSAEFDIQMRPAKPETDASAILYNNAVK